MANLLRSYITVVDRFKLNVMKKSFTLALISTAIRTVTNFLLIYIIAYVISPNEFGDFIFIFSVYSLFVLVIEFGSNLFLMARSELADDKYLLIDFIILKIILSVITFLLIYQVLAENIHILLLGMAINAIGTTIYPILRCKGLYDEEARVVFKNNSIIVIVFSLGCLIDGLGDVIKIYSFSLLLGKFYLLLYLFSWINFKGWSFSSLRLFNLIKRSYPFLIHSLLGVAMINIDVILLKTLSDTAEVGSYQIIAKGIVGACVLTEVIINVFLPQMNSRPNVEDIKRLRVTCCATGALVSSVFFVAYYVLLNSLFLKYETSNEAIFLISLVVLIRYVAITPGIIISKYSKQLYRVVGSAFGIASLVILSMAFNDIDATKMSLILVISSLVVWLSYEYYGSKTINKA
jgi:O-antigen/teichoic acid export membrane protein